MIKDIITILFGNHRMLSDLNLVKTNYTIEMENLTLLCNDEFFSKFKNDIQDTRNALNNCLIRVSQLEEAIHEKDYNRCSVLVECLHAVDRDWLAKWDNLEATLNNYLAEQRASI